MVTCHTSLLILPLWPILLQTPSMYPRILTAVGVVAMAVVVLYLYKHGQLGSPKEMVDEAAKDVKDAAKAATGK